MTGPILRLQVEKLSYPSMYWVPENGRIKKGRPNKILRIPFQEDLEEMGFSWHGTRMIASDITKYIGLLFVFCRRFAYGYKPLNSVRFI